MEIFVSTKFTKRLKKLPKSIQELVFEKEALFRSNPFSDELKTHKLKGKLKHTWSFSINYQYRIVFEFIDKGKALFISVGTHDIYN